MDDIESLFSFIIMIIGICLKYDDKNDNRSPYT
jgi:hypothetical protein